ncbi:1-deoxy-D-xylulose-5-phosphate synthase [Marinobacterium arenosum]|uniref:1-deoxy-D-xylulose-5-phosphate synthase n=1 Tax=Marinobacterium arenosum TaxID=2862496 RepID=UPI001C97C3A9|nr:1-deoxy-D-xylulose-5-phosphate synthase [Marinobacterium arenosum]MBY4675537.1 1-deoxy-D-xylulose-5-phosphate synthase [Marinobacterium arenosum]
MFQQIPTQRPTTPLLDQINDPADLRRLNADQLPQLAEQLRAYLLYSVGQTGGHFGAGLGVVELTIALHYLLDTPSDKLIWDVGHQSYPHKILTGRREQMLSMRQPDGLAPFPRMSESPYDAFGTGHSSTSISAALGMALAARLQGRRQKTVAVIGDGAMTAGMAFEALNHATHTGGDLLVILNDNDMSISHNEGGLANYICNDLKNRTAGEQTGALFGTLDFEHHGPVDGNDLEQLLPLLDRVLQSERPQFLHLLTRKGKGFEPAEADPVGYHAIGKIEPLDQRPKPKKATFANSFGRWITELAAQDERLVGITPAMREGSDLVAFSQQFPERYFDVAIAEQHAVTLAAGFACEGMKPVVAIYSTFLQRAYDQLVHDVAIQDLDVLFAIDRAGLVGEDGATHAGLFDISYLRCLPGMLIMTPADEQEQRNMLYTGYLHQGPAAVRYPRGSGSRPDASDSLEQLEIGKSRPIRQGERVAILNFGPLLPAAAQAAEQLNATLVDMRFVKPLDCEQIDRLAASHELLVSVEDHAIQGGAGSAVGEYLQPLNVSCQLLTLGVPDRWIEHASRQAQLAECGLDADGIRTAIEAQLG